MYERFERRLDDWAARKPTNLLSVIGLAVGGAVGFIGGLAYDGYKFLPTVLDLNIQKALTESAESVVVAGLSTVLGALVLSKVGEGLDHFMENPDNWHS